MPVQVQYRKEWEEAGITDMLSVIIPTHNEEGCIQSTVEKLIAVLQAESIAHEILVINDNSSDRTGEILVAMTPYCPTMRVINNTPPNGFGFAIRQGLLAFNGEAVALYMADASDAPEDLVRFYRKLQEGYDCVFGNRFTKGGRVYNYPWPKLVLNRLGNLFIRLLLRTGYNDTSNAFKLYRRHVIAGLHPLLSYQFNITIELPLKAIIRGYSFAVVPNSWENRSHGISKFKIKEMGSRYLFIVFYCLIEKIFMQGEFSNLPTESEQCQNWTK
ncbi:glycosyl transferase, family 2 [Magnetococcus marinus MC-1]|uniref:Glycosyl transferase, family 2 n=1 Tax=Magnetococcus marinus (strain ATCC BAA-1437 / JCM 17883 / MC-1) TaxID=156889 RepID=A0LBL8_MAGMM|nr:glycosyltransferase family 2 protein [Magnetococcus marinus]ABK45361.1 glycosyl transferase, family 2 [Magnetococcus marinus MC-1]